MFMQGVALLGFGLYLLNYQSDYLIHPFIPVPALLIEKEILFENVLDLSHSIH